MNTTKQVTIITIPLVYYHEQLYWGLYDEQTGKVRNTILNRPTAGKQIAFSFKHALAGEGDILILTDDKFGFEKIHTYQPSDNEYELFVAMNSMPVTWQNAFANGHVDRLVIPPPELYCGAFTFSERKLYARSRHIYGLPGECANEWTDLLAYLESLGYEKVRAYIPQVCAKGICYSTPYAMESGIYTKGIEISFTKGASVAFEYPNK